MTRWGHEFDAIELVVSTKWRDSGCLFLVAPAKAGAKATGAVPALDARFRVAFAGMRVRWVNAER
jgi:hypothetical protein